MERRGDLPAIPLGCYGFFMNDVPYDQCANEVWLDRQRALAFVHYGLRPVFPENWERNVLTYFKGANGEDFRYEQMPWGTAFVQYAGGQRKLQYGRINGVARAAVEGAILGWPCYDEHGLVGLNPDESATYCLDPAGRRPPVWFSLPVDDVYVADGYADEDLAYFQLRPVPSRAAATNSVYLNAASGPVAVWVDGKAVKPVAAGANRWAIAVNRDSFVAAIFREPPAGFASLATHKILCRDVDPVTRRDILRPSFLAATVSQIKEGVKIEPRSRRPVRSKVNLRYTFRSRRRPTAFCESPASRSRRPHVAGTARRRLSVPRRAPRGKQRNRWRPRCGRAKPPCSA